LFVPSLKLLLAGAAVTTSIVLAGNWPKAPAGALSAGADRLPLVLVLVLALGAVGAAVFGGLKSLPA
jgi:hypothetical protein